MKRSQALASLSRDHHQALFAAQRLRRCTPATAAAARDGFLAYWGDHGRRHFRLEEEVLFPAYAGHGDPQHPDVLRALGEHALIRHRAAALAETPELGMDALVRLGEALAAHVRLEERAIFPLVERTLPDDVLAAVARALDTDRPAEA